MEIVEFLEKFGYGHTKELIDQFEEITEQFRSMQEEFFRPMRDDDKAEEYLAALFNQYGYNFALQEEVRMSIRRRKIAALSR